MTSRMTCSLASMIRPMFDAAGRFSAVKYSSFDQQRQFGHAPEMMLEHGLQHGGDAARVGDRLLAAAQVEPAGGDLAVEQAGERAAIARAVELQQEEAGERIVPLEDPGMLIRDQQFLR